MRAIRLGVGIGAAAVVGALAAVPALASAAGFADRLGPGVEVTRQDETGKVGFIGARPGSPLDSGAAPSAAAATAARTFVRAHAGRFGLAGDSALRVLDTEPSAGGGTSVRLRQLAGGLPVLGGELVVSLDARRGVLSVLGEASPSPEVTTDPAIGAADAEAAALGAVARAHDLDRGRLRASTPRLRVYDPRLLGAPGPVQRGRTSWVLEVTADSPEPLRELVVVDAEVGNVALHFDQIAEALDRDVCDADNTPTQLPCTSPVRTEGDAPVADATFDDINDAYDFAGDTYDFFFDRFGRDSLDGAGLVLSSTVDYCPTLDPDDCPYENAFWNGEQMTYGDGFAAGDDVVAHELTHGVTEFSSHLFYYQQSGAINESMSDVFGEFVDLTNLPADEPADRWLLAEDIPIGAIRDMQDPTVFNDPDRMTSPFYTADPDEVDGGGVHSNSGVNNKAAYLITDGDTFNGRTITGIGIDKAARIYYEVNNAMLTSASDFADLANALRQACANLASVGTDGITIADCAQVDEAVAAVEMDTNPPAAPTSEAPTCTDGLAPAFAFADDLESPGLGRWASGPVDGATDVWSYPQNPNPYTPDFDATYATSGVTNFFGDDPGGAPGDPDPPSDSAIAMTAPVTVPEGGYLRFNHAYGFEDDASAAYDGGVVEFSTDGGASWSDLGPSFDAGGYGGAIVADEGNPLAGRPAFVRESNGYGSSRANLAPLAGQSVRFRFRIGTDAVFGDFGWFIDDIVIYACRSAAPETGPPETGPPETGPPDTEITKEKVKRAKGKGKRARGRASFRFEGTSAPPGRELGFECKLDRKRFKPCDSPAKYRPKVKRHRFRVRAIDVATGAADPTPAKERFRVRRKAAGR